jgi:hypothetical protein
VERNLGHDQDLLRERLRLTAGWLASSLVMARTQVNLPF